jgi:hypothetical protein
MKVFIAICMTVLMTQSVFAKTKSRCRKNYTKISCEKIEGAKRQHFCWKGTPEEKKKMKICTSERKSRKAKKVIKSKS